MANFILDDKLNKTQPVRGINGAAYVTMDPSTSDVTGRAKVTMHQNIYDADFEYGKQPLRWEELNVGSGSITHNPSGGNVKMSITSASGDINIRQSRPYHRYQPAKSLYMATAVNFGTANINQRQRVGFFDDSNGCFFEQADPIAVTNPSGIYAVYRSDISGTPTDVRIGIDQFNGDTVTAASLDWTRIQMLFIEYAWYGAGSIRFGTIINGRSIILHSIGFGNRANQTVAWSRTGNLPVRYEQRNIGASVANDMFHWGVSVILEGGYDEQRGFTYAYGMARATPTRSVSSGSLQYPVLTIRNRQMGTLEYTQASSAISAATTTTMTATGTPWTVDQWKGRYVFFASNNLTARITGNTTSVLTFADPITGLPLASAPTAATNYIIGQPNRGQLLPRKLVVSADKLCIIELIAGTPAGVIALTGASFQALSGLGSTNSFAERDVSATALSGGEVVYAFTSPSGGSGLIEVDLSFLFPLYSNIKGNVMDTLTVAVTNQTGSNAVISATILCQEAMS